ncbi:MAG TPA: Tm-1-like ATP-binding domain-containing protein [Anaerolineae bacterium]|nr:Tm-1-like ATP-binding domain-containing protein [Anaerolineae bacterium]
MTKKILVLGTLDTKGAEIAFLKRSIELSGCRATVMDVGILGQPATQADITREDVARAAGQTLEQIRALPNRKRIIGAMIQGAIEKAKLLHGSSGFDGVVGIGGGTGMHICTAIMRSLPMGLPKLMVSSMASMDVSEFVGAKDITMMTSVADLASLNTVTRTVLAQAAGAICGMAGASVPSSEPRTAIAMTSFGITTQCADNVGRCLREMGHELVVFHTVGSGGMAMEELLDQGLFVGVLDLTTHEFIDQVAGGHYGGVGDERLETAGRKGIPQVVGPGGLDCVAIFAPEGVPAKFAGRRTYYHDFRVCVRSTAAELEVVARILADKLNEAAGPVKFLVPLRGWSSASRHCEPLFDPEADRAFVDALKGSLKPDIEIREIDAHIDDMEYAQAAVSHLHQMMTSSSR